MVVRADNTLVSDLGICSVEVIEIRRNSIVCRGHVGSGHIFLGQRQGQRIKGGRRHSAIGDRRALIPRGSGGTSANGKGDRITRQSSGVWALGGQIVGGAEIA